VALLKKRVEEGLDYVKRCDWQNIAEEELRIIST